MAAVIIAADKSLRLFIFFSDESETSDVVASRIEAEPCRLFLIETFIHVCSPPREVAASANIRIGTLPNASPLRVANEHQASAGGDATMRCGTGLITSSLRAVD